MQPMRGDEDLSVGMDPHRAYEPLEFQLPTNDMHVEPLQPTILAAGSQRAQVTRGSHNRFTTRQPAASNRMADDT
jgi:hypothetical protein